MTPIRRARVGSAAALMLTGALALSACSASPASSGSEDGENAETSAASLLPEAEGDATYPMTLESPWGSTELEARPERIAAVTPSQDDVEILAALGVTPVIASEWSTDVWLDAALEEPIAERYTTGDSQFPAEQIAAADPDLIIVLGADVTDDYDKLASIAPVLSTAEEIGSEMSIANDWDANIRRVGEVLDLEQAAEQVLEDEEAFFADFREAHPEFEGLTASYLVYYGEEGGLQYHSSPDGPTASVFERMGFAENPLAADFTYRQEVSEELLSAVDADVIVFSDNSEGNHATVTEQPLFQKLQAVEDGHLVLVDNRNGTFAIDGEEHEGNMPWAFARSGPLSSAWAAEQLAPALQNALQD